MSPKGIPLSPEHRAKLSLIRKGKPKSPEHRAKIGAANKGRRPADTTRAAVSAANKARIPSLQQRARASAAMMGNRHQVLAPIKGECVYCFGPAQTYDHVIPRGRHGWDTLETVPSCYSCNASKGQRTPDEWLDDSIAGRPDPYRVAARKRRSTTT